MYHVLVTYLATLFYMYSVCCPFPTWSHHMNVPCEGCYCYVQCNQDLQVIKNHLLCLNYSCRRILSWQASFSQGFSFQTTKNIYDHTKWTVQSQHSVSRAVLHVLLFF